MEEVQSWDGPQLLCTLDEFHDLLLRQQPLYAPPYSASGSHEYRWLGKPVLLKCEYCGGGRPPSSEECPNCGA